MAEERGMGKKRVDSEPSCASLQQRAGCRVHEPDAMERQPALRSPLQLVTRSCRTHPKVGSHTVWNQPSLPSVRS